MKSLLAITPYLQAICRSLAVILLTMTLPLSLTIFTDSSTQWLIFSASFVLLLDALLRLLVAKEKRALIYLQIVAALPWELLAEPLVLLRMSYLPFWLMQGSLRAKIRQYFLIPFALERSLASALGVLLLTHWIACGWIAIHGVENSYVGWESYIQAQYWTVVTMASVGYGDITPHTIIQKIYAIFVIFLGVGIYGYIIGNVASLLATLDRAKERHRERVAEMHSWLQFRQVPKSLRRRVLEHLNLLWEKRLSLDDSALLHQLPTNLRAEVATFLHRKLLEKVPLLASAPPIVLAELSTRLRPMVFQPNEIICQSGEAGDEMFFVSQGELEVINPLNGFVIATLSSGSFFGEIALLAKVPRTATVRTSHLCEVHALRSDDFHAVLANHPEFAAQIRAEAKRRQNELLIG